MFYENEIAIIASIYRVIEENKEFYAQFDYDLHFNRTTWNGFRDDFGNALTGSVNKEIKIDLKV